MSELQTYSELSAEIKAQITESEYNDIREVFKLNSDGLPEFKTAPNTHG
jgi:hypothetical protein